MRFRMPPIPIWADTSHSPLSPPPSPQSSRASPQYSPPASPTPPPSELEEKWFYNPNKLLNGNLCSIRPLDYVDFTILERDAPNYTPLSPLSPPESGIFDLESPPPRHFSERDRLEDAPCQQRGRFASKITRENNRAAVKTFGKVLYRTDNRWDLKPELFFPDHEKGERRQVMAAREMRQCGRVRKMAGLRGVERDWEMKIGSHRAGKLGIRAGAQEKRRRRGGVSGKEKLIIGGEKEKKWIMVRGGSRAKRTKLWKAESENE